MVDLHAHTDRSDGTLSPRGLVDLARQTNLAALAITDHDTIAGYDDAAPYAREVGLELVCGVELGARYDGSAIHVLGYFLEAPPDELFRRRLEELKQARRERNERLAERLRSLGLDVRVEEAEALGREQTGRPHFARLLVSKGYVANYREAFEVYLDEQGKGFVPRREPSLETVFGWIRDARGVSSWAHPGRFVRKAGSKPEESFQALAAHGLQAVEAYHRDHLPEESKRFDLAAQKLGLGVTGGSDFHGPTLGGVPLGGLHLKDELLERLRSFSRSLYPAA